MTNKNFYELPEVCAAWLHGTIKPQSEHDSPILIVRGTSGYWEKPHIDPASYNEHRNITSAQVEAMKFGSLFGFHTDGANPDTYEKGD